MAEQVDGTTYLLGRVASLRRDLKNTRKQLHRARKGRQERSKTHAHHYSVDEWRTHDLIVARIRAIPDRDILGS